MKKLFLPLVLSMLFGLLSCKTTLSVADFEAEILRLTNIQRAQHQLPALLAEEGLSSLARHHAQNMARFDFFEHQDQEGLQVGGRQKKYYPQLMAKSIGENLAFHQNSKREYDPAEIVEGWMNSPGHRENILSKDFSHLGVAVLLTGDKLYSVQNFAYPIVKLQSKSIASYQKDKIYRFQFQYLAVEPKQSFEAYLILPDSQTKVMLTPNSYALGVKPIEPKWIDAHTFSLDLPFSYGKGQYRLAFGWGKGHYDSDFKFQVK